MTSDSSHSRPVSDASDASRCESSTSELDATGVWNVPVPEAKRDAFQASDGEPAPPSDDAFFSFDDASTRTSAPPFGAENDKENEPIEDERTVVSRTPPVESERKSEASGSVGPEGDALDGADGGALKPGAQFGHFVVTKYIGGGGMGRVYEGRDTALDRKVAIKVLPRQRAQDVGTVARFLNEAKSAARLNHEHIAQVYFCGEENGVPFIAFEYVYGVNLRDYVRERGVLELDEAIGYVLQAADALAHAAAHGVTHRDVKPSNIIVTPQKRAKLIDMGLARLLKND
ncbi:MAG: serine/threonine protein kinase, partial [Thermoguttaceae bacterium]|nr:serine/threonine protein kinase [Thermoguttaceae bacterium]